jgi:two-component system OmpR family sensor kinase
MSSVPVGTGADDVVPAEALPRKASRWSSLTLTRRLVIGLVAVTAATLVVVAGATFLALRAWLIDQVDADLMAPKYQLYSDQRDRNPLDEALRGWQSAGATLVTLNDGTATTLPFQFPGGDSSSSSETWSSSDAAELATVPTSPSAEPVTVELESVGVARAVAVPAQLRDGTPVTVVAVSPMSEVYETASRLVVVEILAVAGAILLVAVVGTWFVRREMKPLKAVAETASGVAALPLDRGDVVIPARVADTNPGTEVGQVGLAVNAMLDHVETSLRTRAETEDKLRRFVSDAGHELRTPLASVRGYAELMRRGAAADPESAAQAASRIEAAASRMGLLVEDLLLLASLDEERPLSRERLGLGSLVEDAVSEVSATGPDHTWRTELGAGDGPYVVGDSSRLYQAVANLLANARAHTPAGTTVTACTGQDGTTAWVEVRDDGPGFPEDLLPRATERFARGDYSRSRATGGSGLGLAIVKAVVEAHDGVLSVGNSSEGPGAVIRIELPLAGASPVETVAPYGTAAPPPSGTPVEGIPAPALSRSETLSSE